MWVKPENVADYRQMLHGHEPLVINAVGHLAGAIVFAIFLALALRGAISGRLPRQTLLSIASGALAWIWNACSFAALLLPNGTARWAVEAASFASLSLLPAVLLHLSLGGRFRKLAIAGYLLSATATTMHLCEGLQPDLRLHQGALWVITFGFGALTVIYTAGMLWQEKETRGRTSQILASMCLLLFAVTFSHFGSGGENQRWRELIVHHAGIPVALLVLLTDYRFVFADAFVRFLANVLLAATLSYAGLRLAAGLTSKNGTVHPLADVFVVAGLSVLLILFAYLRGVVQRWLTKVVFRARRTEGTVQELRAKAAEIRNETEYLEKASACLAAAVGASRFEILDADAGHVSSAFTPASLDYPSLRDEAPWVGRDPRWSWAEAVVPIRLARRDVRHILLGRRRGGKRYLSEDLRSLNYLSTVMADEIGRYRALEMQRLVSEAELRALHAQINPHFLFNALNTLYGIIPREAAGARRTVLNLAEIFRYFLQSDKTLIPLQEELKIVEAYLDIERLRLGPRLQTLIQVDQGAERTLIPILSVQPLVENAVKHGLANCPDPGWLRLSANLSEGALTITVEDRGASAPDQPAVESTAGTGVGLANVTRRLQLCFGPEAGVTVMRGPFGTQARFSVPLAANEPAQHASARG